MQILGHSPLAGANLTRDGRKAKLDELLMVMTDDSYLGQMGE
jgi:hypothetical protein